mgnify:CR=1 FL=1
MEIPLVNDLTKTFNININDLNIDKRMIEIFNSLNYNLSTKDIYNYSKFPQLTADDHPTKGMIYGKLR